MLVNRKFLRIFLIFLILFGGYQIIEILAVKDSGVPDIATFGIILLIATIMAIAGYVLYKAK